MKLAKFIQPEGDKILVLPNKAEEKTESGIIVSTNAAGKKSQMGTVLAISTYLAHVWAHSLDSDKRIPLTTVFTVAERKFNGIAVGDTVAFADYSGDDFKIKDLETGEMVTVKILPIELVLGIVTDPE